MPQEARKKNMNGKDRGSIPKLLGIVLLFRLSILFSQLRLYHPALLCWGWGIGLWEEK